MFYKICCNQHAHMRRQAQYKLFPILRHKLLGSHFSIDNQHSHLLTCFEDHTR